MTCVSRSICKRVLTATLAMACGASIAAAKPPAAAQPAPPAPPAAKAKAPAKKVQASTSNQTFVAGLKQAYIILAAADHDYKGHRAHAMRAIEAACKLLGDDISGNGAANEPQSTSDAQLRQAKAILIKVRDEVAPAKKPKVLAQINVAINQVTIALTIK